MKTNTSWKRVVIVVALGVALLGIPLHPAVSQAIAAGGATSAAREPNAVGGCDASIHASAELFHLGTGQVDASWTPTGELNIGRYAHTATLLADGRVLVAGGRASDNCFAPTSSAELYDPVSGTWTPTGSLNTARADHTATLLQNGLVLVAGGYGDGYLDSAELYDPATGTWHPTGSFKTIRALSYYNLTPAAPLLPNGKVLVVGTSASGYETELYDAETGTWSSTSSPNTRPYNIHGMVLLPNGKVLAVSRGCCPYDYGYDDGSGAELYDPATEQWSLTGYDNNIYPNTMTLLRNGKVLVTGADDVPVRAGIYNPSTGKWSGTGNLTLGYGAYYKATLLADGQVLVSSSRGAELYDPTTGAWGRTSPPLVPRHHHTATLLGNGTTLIAGGVDDGLVSPPWITSVRVLKKRRPIATIVAGTKAKKLSLEVYGLDFDSGAELLVNGEALELDFAHSTGLGGRFTQPMVRRPGELTIQVRNSSGKISNTVILQVVAGQ